MESSRRGGLCWVWASQHSSYISWVTTLHLPPEELPPHLHPIHMTQWSPLAWLQGPQASERTQLQSPRVLTGRVCTCTHTDKSEMEMVRVTKVRPLKQTEISSCFLFNLRCIQCRKTDSFMMIRRCPCAMPLVFKKREYQLIIA